MGTVYIPGYRLHEEYVAESKIKKEVVRYGLLDDITFPSKIDFDIRVTFGYNGKCIRNRFDMHLSKLSIQELKRSLLKLEKVVFKEGGKLKVNVTSHGRCLSICISKLSDKLYGLLRIYNWNLVKFLDNIKIRHTRLKSYVSY